MSVRHTKFAMMFVISFAAATLAADNEIYIDQIGDGSSIDIVQDGSGNVIGGSTTDTTKMVLNGANMNFSVNQTGSGNTLIGSVFGTSTIDIDVAGSTNDILFDVDKDNTYGAIDGNYLLNITGSNNDLDIDVGSLDTANDLDFDFVLDGDFNTADINIDASSLTFDLDVIGDNNNLLYDASGYDGHKLVVSGSGSYNDIQVNQESTLQTDTLEIDFDGSGTSTTAATICISQSDSGLNTTCE
jgi:hypothetical protein